MPAHAPPTTGRPRVLIVDDSAVVRAVLARILENSGRFEIAAAVPDALRALALLQETRVDVILLDLEMPRVHGLAALPELLAAADGAKVLVVSSSCEESGAAATEALARGAADTLAKPGAGALLGDFAQALTSRLDRLAKEPGQPGPARAAGAAGQVGADVIAIGASTGGLHALSRLFGALDPATRAPILITQHLPLAFSQHLALQVEAFARRPCAIATDGAPLREGHVLVAPGDAHLVCTRLAGKPAVRLSRRPQANGCLPSVDPMFTSVAEVFGAGALGIVLSGMGRDGAMGARAIREKGGTVIVQDRESSVVWGMPKAVYQAGHASMVLAPEAIGAALKSRRKVA